MDSTVSPIAAANQPKKVNLEDFAKLPPEMRLMNWEAVARLQEPRVVHIQQKRPKKTIGDWEKENGTIWPPLDASTPQRARAGRSPRTPSKQQLEAKGRFAREWVSKRFEKPYKKVHLVEITCKTSVPFMLHVCRESREVALKRYTLAFACPQSNPKTYLDFARDTLYFTWENFNKYRMEYTSPGSHLDVWNSFRCNDFSNLSKVEKLAIGLPPIDELFDETCIAEVLRVFTNVKRLSLVGQHYHDPSLSAVDQSDLCLTYPVDVEEAFTAFENFGYNPDQYYNYYGETIEVPEVPWLDLDLFYFDPEELGRIKDRDGYWELPQIEDETLLPRKTALELQDMEKGCQDTIDEIAERVWKDEQRMYGGGLREDSNKSADIGY